MTRGGTAELLLVVTALSCVLAGAAVPAGGAHGSGSAFAAAGQIDADTVLLDVSLAPDGDARWEIRYRVRLDDDNETAAFASLEGDVEENRSAYASRFESRIAGTVSAAENATGREMSVSNVTVRTTRQEIPQRYGVLVYGFEWTAFATTDGPRIRAGDAVGGLFLDESTSLTVQWPDGYRLASADPDPDESGDRSATWRGPTDFTTEQPRVVVTSGTPTAGPGDGDGDSGAGGFPGTTLLVGGLVAVGAVAAGAWWWLRRRPSPPAPVAADDATGEEPPEELLSNEERVIRLLREHGGRMKQQQVVEELGWTDAKTSQVVGDLRESGEIEGFRLGRENVLRLPSEDDDPGPGENR